MDSPIVIVIPAGPQQRRLLEKIDALIRDMDDTRCAIKSAGADEEAPLWTWFLPNPMPPQEHR